MARLISPRAMPTSLAATLAPQAQTKREKRRTIISDKLEAMKESFEAAHQEHFYAQLSATHCDINLIMQADPHQGPLDDSPGEIARLVNKARAVVCSRPIAAEAEKSFENLSGRAYARYVDEVNAAAEQRDADLTMAFNSYQSSLRQLKHSHAYRVHLAREEHKLLSQSLRERLIQQVSQKKAKLLKDKEQLDIADSNALLLNPTQFSIGNAVNNSGGAGGNPRKTRNTRGRPGEGDEPAALSTAEANAGARENGGTSGKRKRKAIAVDEESGSPGPPDRKTFKNGDGNGDSNGIANRFMTVDDALNGTSVQLQSIPYARDAKARAAYSQFEAPLYSIDRLFSEKELLMTMNRAHITTTEHFERLKARGIESRLYATVAAAASAKGKSAMIDKLADMNGHTEAQDEASEPAQNSLDPATTHQPATTTTTSTSRAATPLPAQPTHTTRATLRSALPPSTIPTPANPGTSVTQPSQTSALDSLSTLALQNPSSNLTSTIPTTYPTASTTMIPPYALGLGLATTASASKANPAAPPPPGASESEIAEDLRLINEGCGSSWYGEYLERCCEGYGWLSGVGGVGARKRERESDVRTGRPRTELIMESEEAGDEADVVMDGVEDDKAIAGAGLGISGAGIGAGVAMSKGDGGTRYRANGAGGESMSRTGSGRGGGA